MGFGKKLLEKLEVELKGHITRKLNNIQEASVKDKFFGKDDFLILFRDFWL
jgi:hypothetical protein